MKIVMLHMNITKVKYLSIAIFVISSILIVKTAVAKETFKLTINSKYNMATTATFKTGRDVNYQMKVLAGMNANHAWIWNEYDKQYNLVYSHSIYADFNITSVVKAEEDEYEEVKGYLDEDNIVSTEDSKYLIYMWYENGVIYYYSEAEKIYLNSDSSSMFYELRNTTSLDISDFDTSNVTDMSFMFGDTNGNYINESIISEWVRRDDCNTNDMFGSAAS